MTAWQHVCVLCAARDRTTRLESGHVCAVCVTRLKDDLTSIVQNGDLSAVGVRSGGGAYATTGFDSKAPIDLDRTAPYLAQMRLYPLQQPEYRPPIAEVLAGWERIVREQRGLAPYGLATADHVGTDEGTLAAQASRAAVAMLRKHLPWITTEPTFPLEDFAYEIHACATRMHALASPGPSSERLVWCPTITDDQDENGAYLSCNARLTITTWAAVDGDHTIGKDVTCPRCKVTRSPEQLLHAAGKEGTWADAEAITTWYAVSARTLRRWAEKGEIRRQHGLYSIADVQERRAEGMMGA